MELDNLFEVVKKVGQAPYKKYVDDWVKTSITSYNYFGDMFKRGMIFTQYKSLEDAFNNIIETRNIPKDDRTVGEQSALKYVADDKYESWKSFNDFIVKDNQELVNVKQISDVILTNIKDLINLGGMYEKDRLIVTQDDRGIFDFGLASSGLFRPVEFYSEKLAQEIDDGMKNPFAYLGNPSGVVDADMVNKLLGQFFFTYENKSYVCERRQRGATKVFNKYPDICFLKPNEENIKITYYNDNPNKVFNGKNGTRLKYASSNKKSYLVYQKKADSVRYVDIFVPINFLVGNRDSARVVNLIPAFLIASALEEFGIYARISALRTGSDNQVNTTVSIPVKDYTESAKESFNKTFAILGTRSEAGNFFAFFKVRDSNSGEQGVVSGDYGSSFSPVNYEKQIYMNELMQRYKNWVKVNKDKDFVNTKVLNDNFQFAISQRPNSARKLDMTDILKELHFIFFQFYYYLDFLAIEFLPIDEFIKQLYSRMIGDEQFRSLYDIPKSKKEILNLIRKYVLGILAEKYQTVSTGEYSDDREEITRKEQLFAQKIDRLDESLNIL